MANIGIVVLLLGAFFGSTATGVFCYMRNQAYVARTHHPDPSFPVRLNTYAITGTVVGALPGLTLFLIARRKNVSIAEPSEVDNWPV